MSTSQSEKTEASLAAVMQVADHLKPFNGINCSFTE